MHGQHGRWSNSYTSGRLPQARRGDRARRRAPACGTTRAASTSTAWAGHGVAIVGHCNPAVVAAIRDQAEHADHLPRDLLQRRARPAAGAAGRAWRPAGLERVFLCNSGTEAVEAALKFARLSTGRPGIVATMRGFHGRTMGALSATWEPEYREPFQPLVPGFSHVPYNNLDAHARGRGRQHRRRDPRGRAGRGRRQPRQRRVPARRARALCRERGALLIVDEVQTGFGRTGQAVRLRALRPAPRHAVPGQGHRRRRADGRGADRRAACRTSNRACTAPPLAATRWPAPPRWPRIDVHGRARPARPGGAQGRLGARAAAAASSRRVIREVRGLGLMIGIELRQRVTPYLQALMDEGVLALPAGTTVLRLLPPLVIRDEDLATRLRRHRRGADRMSAEAEIQRPSDEQAIALLQRDASRIHQPLGPRGRRGRLPGALRCRRWAMTRHVDAAGNAVGELRRRARAELLLLGHIDTVPGRDPRAPRGRAAIGRGAVDAKGRWRRLSWPRPRAALAAGVTVTRGRRGGGGGRHLAGRLPCGAAATAPRPCVIGEPSGWDRVTLGYKGRLLVDYRLERRMAHTRRPASETVCEEAVAYWQRWRAWADGVSTRDKRARIRPRSTPRCARSTPATTACTSGDDDHRPAPAAGAGRGRPASAVLAAWAGAAQP